MLRVAVGQTRGLPGIAALSVSLHSQARLQLNSSIELQLPLFLPQNINIHAGAIQTNCFYSVGLTVPGTQHRGFPCPPRQVPVLLTTLCRGCIPGRGGCGGCELQGSATEVISHAQHFPCPAWEQPVHQKPAPAAPRSARVQQTAANTLWDAPDHGGVHRLVARAQGPCAAQKSTVHRNK